MAPERRTARPSEGAVGGASAQVRPFPLSRRLIVDVGRATRVRSTVRAFIEADVTEPRRRMAAAAPDGPRVTLTCYIVSCVGRAVTADRRVHALRDLRGRLVTFDDVDVNVSVEVELESGSFPMNHVVRRAGARTPADICTELQRVKRDPGGSPTMRLAGPARWFLALPGIVRRGLLRLLYRLPRQQKALAGTVGVTAIGMMGEGGGWGTAFQVHPLSVVVGGITVRPGLVDGKIEAREFLHLTLAFDHDVVDGAPAARFASRLRQLIESGEGLP